MEWRLKKLTKSYISCWSFYSFHQQIVSSRLLGKNQVLCAITKVFLSFTLSNVLAYRKTSNYFLFFTLSYDIFYIDEWNLTQEKFLKEECFKLYVVIYAQYFIFILLGCEGSWYVGLTTLSLSYVNSLEILGAPASLSPKGLSNVMHQPHQSENLKICNCLDLPL